MMSTPCQDSTVERGRAVALLQLVFAESTSNMKILDGEIFEELAVEIQYQWILKLRGTLGSKRCANGVIDLTGVRRVGKGQRAADSWRRASSRHAA